MSWQFVCRTCGHAQTEDDANEGVASCENRACAMYGNTVRVEAEKIENVSPLKMIPVEAMSKAKSVVINLNFNL